MKFAAPAVNQSVPELYHGWMPTPNERGTSDILWTCLATTFLCVWTSLHLSVPFYQEKAVRISEDWKKWLGRTIVESKLVPAVICFIVPELMAISAIEDFRAARNISQRMRRRPDHNGGFSLVHGFFLNMGGFCLRSPLGRCHQLSFEDVETALEAYEKQHSYREDDCHKAAAQILSPLYTGEWILRLEAFKADEIYCLSKSDGLTKLIALFQASWFVAQVMTRLAKDQAVTLLEISTSAYVTCAFIAYASWWKMPQGCAKPLIIEHAHGAFAEFQPNNYERNKGTWEEFLWGLGPWRGRIVIFDDMFTMGPVIGLPLLFGAIHAASWNIALPSRLETCMWRLSIILCVSIPVVFSLSLWLSSLVFKDYRSYGLKRKIRVYSEYSKYRVSYALFYLYAIVRLYMVIEIFLSMRALPRSAYKAIKWSDALPHL